MSCRRNNRWTKRSIKRHWQEVHTLGSGLSPEQPNPTKSPITFSDEDLPHEKVNSEVPLIIAATILGVDVRRLLVDQGSAVNVIFKGLLPELKLLDEDLAPYHRDDLIGFYGSRLTPVGQLALRTIFGRGANSRAVEVDFLVLSCAFVYHGILGWPILAKLGAVPSTMHLTLKFRSDAGKVVSLPTDMELVDFRNDVVPSYWRFPSLVTLLFEKAGVIVGADEEIVDPGYAITGSWIRSKPGYESPVRGEAFQQPPVQEEEPLEEPQQGQQAEEAVHGEPGFEYRDFGLQPSIEDFQLLQARIDSLECGQRRMETGMQPLYRDFCASQRGEVLDPEANIFQAPPQ